MSSNLLCELGLTGKGITGTNWHQFRKQIICKELAEAPTLPNMLATLRNQLDLNRCPHCSVDRPRFTALCAPTKTLDYCGGNERHWVMYECSRCGGCVLCAADGPKEPITEQYPRTQTMNDEAIPPRARSYLDQAISSLHAPSGAVMLAASAVDAMLKDKGYKDGSLYARINKAVEDHLITKDMGKWAHDVRLDANDERHVDENATMPNEEAAKRVVEFTKSLAMFLFTLPAMVTRGIKEAKQPQQAPKGQK